MRRTVHLSINVLTPAGKPFPLDLSREIDITETSAAEAPVAFRMRTRMMGEYVRVADVAETPLARKAFGAWWTPVRGHPLAAGDMQETRRFWGALATRLASPGIGPMGPKTEPRIAKAIPESGREAAARRLLASLDGSVMMVDGILHMRVGEPVWCVASRKSVSAPLSVRFSDMVNMEAGFALYSMADEAGARELLAAGFSRGVARGWQEPDPQVEFDPDAIGRMDQIQAPSEIAWAMSAACTLGRAGCLPVDALMALVPLKRAVEARTTLDADTVRTLLGPIEKALSAVGPVDFKGSARTPDQFSRMLARQSLVDLAFLSKALSRINATYVPTPDDEAALSGLDL